MKIRRRSNYILFAVALSLIVTTTANAGFVQQGSKLVGTGAVGPDVAQGLSVSLSADGNTAIVGGPGDDNGAGATWVFTRANGAWSQGLKLVGTGAVGAADQGWSVSLSADGNTAVVGGPVDDNNAGAAWVFTRTNGVWSQQGNKLVGSGAVGAAFQGCSVSLSADGNTAIVGGCSDDNLVGAAWVFTRTNGVWSQQGSKLVGTGAVGGWAQQGISVSLSADGNTAIVGGPSGNNSAGAAWVFTRTNGVWSPGGIKLVGTDAVGAFQGSSVSLSADGNTAIVGGPGDDNGAGAAWVFTRANGVWSPGGIKLVGMGAVGAAEQGQYVSLSADGNTAIVGGRDDNNKTGAAWIFTRANGVWSQQGNKLVGTGAVGAAWQGVSVSLSADGNTVIVGGSLDNNQAGAVWVYVSSDSPTQAGSNVTVQPIDPNTGTSPVTITFTNVTTPGTTNVTTTSTGTPPPNGFKLGDPPVYFSIETTAGYSGPIHICIDYSNISYGSEKDLKLFHWSSTTNSWKDVTDPGYPDLVHHIICGTITSFSLFGVFEPNSSFTGFLPPVENLPVMNTAKAGSTIPVKWQLVDGGGGYISDLSVVTGVTFQQVQCSDVSATLTNDVSTTTSGSSGLRYDASTNQFIYTWKTDKSMAGNCYLLTLTLYEFSKYEAYFELK